MDIPLDTEEAARVVLDGEVRPVDLIVDELGEVVVNNVHVGAGAQASRRGAALEGPARHDRRTASCNLGKLGYPIGALLVRRSCRRRSGCGSRSTARSSSTSTSRC